MQRKLLNIEPNNIKFLGIHKLLIGFIIKIRKLSQNLTLINDVSSCVKLQTLIQHTQVHICINMKRNPFIQTTLPTTEFYKIISYFCRLYFLCIRYKTISIVFFILCQLYTYLQSCYCYNYFHITYVKVDNFNKVSKNVSETNCK